jgi:hypothetical protein
MNAILLTVLALSGADAANFGGGEVPGAYGGEYGACADGGHGGHGHRGGRGGWLGPMPQSCYNPSFGCYPSTPFMHRYPAFHGSYYRAAYNYRNYFDYPWHAALHEPTSHFSYHVPAAAAGEAIPRPTPEAASREARDVRTAGGLAPVIDSVLVRPRQR